MDIHILNPRAAHLQLRLESTHLADHTTACRPRGMTAVWLDAQVYDKFGIANFVLEVSLSMFGSTIPT